MRIFNKITGIILVLILSINYAQATITNATYKNNKNKIVVLSDRIEEVNQQYFIYPKSTDLIAIDVINTLNKDGHLSVPNITETKNRISKKDLRMHTKKLLADYRYTYNIDFEILKKIAKALETEEILLITSGLDTSTDFLKPTLWNTLNIPGVNAVKTEYKMYTHFVLINVPTSQIQWQNTYIRPISAKNLELANTSYSPEYKQMEKIKKSSEIIAKDAVYRIESVLIPHIAIKKTPPTTKEKMKYNIQKQYKEQIENVRDLKEKIKKEETPEKKILLQNVKENTAKKHLNVAKDEILKQENTETQNIEKKQEITETQEIKDYNQNKTIEENNNIYVSPINIIIPKM